MDDTYSTYEAKARFSEIIRKVREGQRVIVSYHGTPVAEIRPFEPLEGDLAARLNRLEARGVILRPQGQKSLPTRVTRRTGAVARFLAERDE